MARKYDSSKRIGQKRGPYYKESDIYGTYLRFKKEDRKTYASDFTMDSKTFVETRIRQYRSAGFKGSNKALMKLIVENEREFSLRQAEVISGNIQANIELATEQATFDEEGKYIDKGDFYSALYKVCEHYGKFFIDQSDVLARSPFFNAIDNILKNYNEWDNMFS